MGLRLGGEGMPHHKGAREAAQPVQSRQRPHNTAHLLVCPLPLVLATAHGCWRLQGGHIIKDRRAGGQARNADALAPCPGHTATVLSHDATAVQPAFNRRQAGCTHAALPRMLLPIAASTHPLDAPLTALHRENQAVQAAGRGVDGRTYVALQQGGAKGGAAKGQQSVLVITHHSQL